MVDPDDVTTAAERAAYAAPDEATEPSPASAAAPPAPDAAASPFPEAPPADPSPGAAVPAAPAPQGPGFLETLPWWLVPAILLGVPLLVGLAVQVQHDAYDAFVWKYYWGPIKADAQNVSTLVHDGVAAHSGYNVVNTASWAILLGLCIVGIAQMLARYRTPMDDKLILAATAWVVVGSVAHALEDTGLFSGWLQYLFITPPIYLLFGSFGIASFLVGQWMKRAEAVGGPHAALRILWIVHAILVLAWTALWMKDWPDIVVYVNPLWVAGFAVVSFAVARQLVLKRGVDPSLLTLVLSLGAYLLVGAYVLTYIVDPWNSLGGGGMPSAAILAPALALAGVLLVLALARKAPGAILGLLLVGGALLGGIVIVALYNVLVARLGLPLPPLSGLAVLAAAPALGIAVGFRIWAKHKGQGEALRVQAAVAYLLPINLLIVFAQLVDGFATALGIDLNGYREKQVLSGKVIDGFRSFSQDIGWGFGSAYPTFLAFVPVKFLVSLGVVYAIDMQSKDDVGRHPTLIGLVKFAIIMVGIGPGVRDFTRLALGV